MKKKQALAFGLVSILTVSGSGVGLAAANNNDKDAREQRGAKTEQKRDVLGERLENRRDELFHGLRATKVTGMEVRNKQNEELGEIEDLVLDLQRGHVAYAVVGSGGFLGIGEKLIAVPARLFSLGAEDKYFVLDTTKERLAKAPTFDKSTWPSMTDESWQKIVDRYHGKTENWRAKGELKGAVADIPTAKRLGFMRMSDLENKEVKSLQGERLGDIWDLMVDLPHGRILFAVIEDKPVGSDMANVPPTAFQAGPDKDVLYLNTNKKQLAESPVWDFARPEKEQAPTAYILSVYEYYGQPTEWTEGEANPGVDNTRRNVRDANGRSLTPFDQGTSAEDRRISQQIRKSIVVEAGKDPFSVNAHNIKIITRDGVVTLRGVVNSAGEKTEIANRAKNVEGVKQVHNELEVKGK